jgi:6-pyruvoyltetrahydropterin/6-carboxytetrahydropterin synthase
MSDMEIYKKFRIDAAHRLPKVPSGHKCGRLHGHSYEIEIYVKGVVDPATGWVMDFDEIKRFFQPIHEQLDHRYLNEIEGLENPTSENIARWIWERLKPQLPSLSKIVIEETCTSGCVYEGE